MTTRTLQPRTLRQLKFQIDAKGQRLNLGEKTHVMGVLNVTPDSFSDGGRFLDLEAAVAQAIILVREGADIIDVGGESTRPGAGDVSVDEEIKRVIPVIEAIAEKTKIPISIDTQKSQVAEKALKAGAHIINDVSGLRYDSNMASVAAKGGAALILMHMKGRPRDMQADPRYANLLKEIIESLRESIAIARRSGVKEENLIIDPGIGFGKTVGHNLEILNKLDELKVLGRPICVGTSRKSFIGKVLGLEDTDARLLGTLATSVVAIMKGADILRVHDVKEAVEVARMTDSILNSGDEARWQS